jgi:hypothetical protein
LGMAVREMGKSAPGQVLRCGLRRMKESERTGAPATRIFSPLAVAGLCIAIGRYWYLFKRLMAVFGSPFYRFEHIVTYSSGKVVAKSMRSPVFPLRSLEGDMAAA